MSDSESAAPSRVSSPPDALSDLQLVLPILRDELIHLEEAVRPLLAEKTRYRAPKRLFDLARQLPHLLEVAHASASAEQIVEGGAAFLEAVQSVVADLGTEQTTLSQYMNDLVTLRACCETSDGLLVLLGRFLGNELNSLAVNRERRRAHPPDLKIVLRVVTPGWVLVCLAILTTLRADTCQTLFARFESALLTFGASASEAARDTLKLIADGLRILSDVNMPPEQSQADRALMTPLLKSLESSLLAYIVPAPSPMRVAPSNMLPAWHAFYGPRGWDRQVQERRATLPAYHGRRVPISRALTLSSHWSPFDGPPPEDDLVAEETLHGFTGNPFDGAPEQGDWTAATHASGFNGPLDFDGIVSPSHGRRNSHFERSPFEGPLVAFDHSSLFPPHSSPLQRPWPFSQREHRARPLRSRSLAFDGREDEPLRTERRPTRRAPMPLEYGGDDALQPSGNFSFGDHALRTGQAWPPIKPDKSLI